MNNKLSTRISMLRRQKGWSQKETAAKLGISQALLSHYEKGIRECGLDFLIKAAQTFSCSTDYLLGFSNKPSETEKNNTDNTVEDLKEYPDLKESRTSSINLLNLLYSITARIDNPEINKEFINYISADSYLLIRMFETHYFDKQNFKLNSSIAFTKANANKSEALFNMLSILENENINVNLSRTKLSQEYPVCFAEMSKIINKFE